MLKIYLDNCCLSRPFDNSSDKNVRMETEAKLFIQALIKYGDVFLVSSFVLYSEILENPSEYKRNSILRFVDDYTKEYLGSETMSRALNIATEIIKTGVKAFDAAHIACAIIANCDCFITTDKRILKYKTTRVRILNPVKFVDIWEGIV